jgi:hypothetical protein
MESMGFGGIHGESIHGDVIGWNRMDLWGFKHQPLYLTVIRTCYITTRKHLCLDSMCLKLKLKDVDVPKHLAATGCCQLQNLPENPHENSEIIEHNG